MKDDEMSSACTDFMELRRLLVMNMLDVLDNLYFSKENDNDS